MAATINAADERYIEKSFDVLANGYLKSVTDHRIDATSFDHDLWETPRSLVNYYFQLSPQDELRPYYPLLKRLDEKCIPLLVGNEEIKSRLDKWHKEVRSYEREFSFRPWQADDLDIYHRYLDNKKLWDLLIDDYPGELPKKDAAILLENSNTLPEIHDVSAILWHDAPDNKPVGQIRLEFAKDGSRDSAEISYWLGEQFWNKRIMSKILPLYTIQSFERYPFQSIIAMVLGNNKASQRLLERSGYRLDARHFRFVEKNGSTQYLAMYRAFRSEYL